LTARRDGLNAVVSVKDDGIGIPAGKQSEIFEMFAQLDDSLQRGQSGLGLGLTLVKSLVEMHGGSVTVYSAGLGEGSEFTVSLPLSATEPTKRASQRKSQQSAKESFQIVILDDSKDLADMFAMLLEQMGHDVNAFYDGLTALDFIPRAQPDIVFSDIAMPKMHGYEFAKRLRQTAGSESLVLVALSGFGTKEDHGYALSQGFDYHFVKPLSTQKLEQLFEEVAGNKSAKTAPNGSR
jgi:CheY-like chemotaxis protein